MPWLPRGRGASSLLAALALATSCGGDKEPAKSAPPERVPPSAEPSDEAATKPVTRAVPKPVTNALNDEQYDELDTKACACESTACLTALEPTFREFFELHPRLDRFAGSDVPDPANDRLIACLDRLPSPKEEAKEIAAGPDAVDRAGSVDRFRSRGYFFVRLPLAHIRCTTHEGGADRCLRVPREALETGG